MTEPDISVVLADDHDLFRDGISSILANTQGISVVGQAAHADAALEVVFKHAPDVLLLDVEMPGPAAATTLSRLNRIAPSTRVIILTMHRDRMLGEALLRGGASAFVTKSTPSAELIDVIRRVMFHSPDGTPESRETPTNGGILSAREHEVLRLISHARSNAEIAETLTIAVGTVKRHTNSVYRKLGASSRIDAVRKAILLGVLPR